MANLVPNTFYTFTKAVNGKVFECQARILRVNSNSVSMQFYKDQFEEDEDNTIRHIPLSWIHNARPSVEQEIARELASIFQRIYVGGATFQR